LFLRLPFEAIIIGLTNVDPVETRSFRG
jgi:hypothetical protein